MVEPNPEQSAVDFFTLCQWWAVIWGNAYAECERGGSGRVIALWPVPPWHVRPVRLSDGTPAYEVAGAPPVIIPAEDMVHVKGPSPDGSEGYRLTKLARESFGFALACDRFGSAYFGNMTKIGGVLETPGQLSDNARENLRKSWAQAYQGIDATGKIAVLEEGLKFTPFGVSNEAGQYTETRQHQVYEICRWVGVDPIFVYAFGSNPGGVAEQQTRNFLQFSLNPWLRKWESELGRKCLLTTEKGTFYPEFLRESIIQLDVKTQHEVWAIGIDKGWYDVNEVRKWLNLPPKEPNGTPDAQQQSAERR